jgi:hypothetical protein
MTHTLPSAELSSLVRCYRRICFRRWIAFHYKGHPVYVDDEVPWSIRHYSLLQDARVLP